MSLEADFQEAIRQHAASRELWQQQSTLHEQVRQQLSSDVTNYLAGAKHIPAILRLTKNQALLGNSGGLPTGWAAHPNCTFENVCNIGSANPDSRHPIAQELLSLIGIKDVFHFGRGFNIWRISWPANTPYLMYQAVITSNYLTTVAAYTKLESGAIGGAWAEGATNEWRLTGMQVGGNMAHTYYMIHPVALYPTAGALLMALPAAVIGRADINDQQRWALYPYVGDTQYD